MGYADSEQIRAVMGQISGSRAILDSLRADNGMVPGVASAIGIVSGELESAYRKLCLMLAEDGR